MLMGVVDKNLQYGDNTSVFEACVCEGFNCYSLAF